MKLNTDFSDDELAGVISSAILAGLVPHAQRELPLDEIEVRGDFPALMQFAQMMYEHKANLDKMAELERKIQAAREQA